MVCSAIIRAGTQITAFWCCAAARSCRDESAGTSRAHLRMLFAAGAGHAELVPGWIEQHHPAIAVRRAMVVRDLRAQRQKAVDLRITVPVTWLKADMHTILHSFVLWNGLEEQPGPIRWFDDDLGVALGMKSLEGGRPPRSRTEPRPKGSEQSNETLRMKDTMSAQPRCP